MGLRIENIPEAAELLSDIGQHRSSDEFNEFDKLFWLRMSTEAKPKFFVAGTGRDDLGSVALCNIVLQGGGVLGIAHVGFLMGLEAAGLRFAGIAGTSAGAIMAMGIACARGADIRNQVGEKVFNLASTMPMDTFIDGPYRIRHLIKQFLLNRKLHNPVLWGGWLAACKRLLFKRGLNPGDEFRDWLDEALGELDVHSSRDLLIILNRVETQLEPHLSQLTRKYGGADGVLKKFGIELPMASSKINADNEDLLKIMAASMPTGIKFEFPRDLKYLDPNYYDQSPALLVRASMAIPFFFEPAFMSVNKNPWQHHVESQLRYLEDQQKLDEFKQLDEVAFVDGGIFSNMPSDAFRMTMPHIPTIAIPMVNANETQQLSKQNSISGLVRDVAGAAFAVRNQRDRDAINRQQIEQIEFENRQKQRPPTTMAASFPHKLVTIDTGETNWLNFVMDEAEMSGLFLRGLRRAHRFILTGS